MFKLTMPVPSLCCRYTASSLLRTGPPPYSVIGYFSLGIDAPCAFFLNIPNMVSHVPWISLVQVHAIFTPDAVRSVNR